MRRDGGPPRCCGGVGRNAKPYRFCLADARPSVRPSVDLSLLAAAAAARTEPRRVRDGPRSSGPRPADGRPGSDDAGEKTRTSRRRSPGRTNTSRVCLSATKYDTIRGALNGSVYRTDTATKQWKTEKLKGKERICSEVSASSPGSPWSQT